LKTITHIVNSKSFLGWIQESVLGRNYKNNFILLDLHNANVFEVQGGYCKFSIDQFGKTKLLSIINESDYVIHYFLDYTKSELIVQSNSNVKHFWYFFGGDVYQQINSFRKNIFLPETKRWMRYNWSYRYRIEFRNFYYKYVKRIVTPEKMMLDSVKRIDSLLWYIEDEYNFINKNFTLPEFKYYKFFKFRDVFPFKESRLDGSMNKILLGNSSAVENNHLDFLPIMKGVKFEGEIALSFSYGDQLGYKKYVKKNFKRHINSKVTFIEEMMPLNKYYEWLNSFNTAVMLHSRQQALGNIFYLIANGSKLYMNENNLIYNWLLKIGVRVFSFEKDFKTHLERKEMNLSSVQKKENFQALKNELSRESDFFNNLD